MGYSTTYNGTTYYVNVIPPPSNSLVTTIYFSQYDNQCTQGDLALTLTARQGTYTEMTTMQAACAAVPIANATRTAVGCASLVSTVMCAALAIPTEGVSLLFCDIAWTWADAGGAIDCIQGAIGYISDQLKTNLYWHSLATAMALEDKDLADMFINLLDTYCDKTVNPIFQQSPQMQNLIEKVSPAALYRKGSATLRPAVAPGDSFLAKIIKYIPAEIITVYTAIQNVWKDKPLDKGSVGRYALVLLIITLITPIWTYYATIDHSDLTVPPSKQKRAVFHAIIATISFVIWLCALGDASFSMMSQTYFHIILSGVAAPVVLILYTGLIVPLLERIVLGQPADTVLRN